MTDAATSQTSTHKCKWEPPSNYGTGWKLQEDGKLERTVRGVCYQNTYRTTVNESVCCGKLNKCCPKWNNISCIKINNIFNNSNIQYPTLKLQHPVSIQQWNYNILSVSNNQFPTVNLRYSVPNIQFSISNIQSSIFSTQHSIFIQPSIQHLISNIQHSISNI